MSGYFLELYLNTVCLQTWRGRFGGRKEGLVVGVTDVLLTLSSSAAVQVLVYAVSGWTGGSVCVTCWRVRSCSGAATQP